MKKVLFIDRDGTLVVEPPGTFQVDSFNTLRFIPGVFKWLGKIATELNYELVMITNQDGLGTQSFPEQNFWPVHNFILQALQDEGICFKEVLIDRSFPNENKPTRKPGTALLTQYFSADYNLQESFVIGDRQTDVQLAKNLGCKSIMIKNFDSTCEDADLIAEKWEEIYNYLKLPPRIASVKRKTKETDLSVTVNLDGTGKSTISTGLNFFDHMLEQVARHGKIDLDINCKGDLHVDEHHTIEDTAIVLGEALNIALGDKRGIERYGFCLPMDDCLAQVALDFGGRNWIEWDAEFNREKIGDTPAEMFYHFFKSFSDNAKCNITIKAEGKNEHHKIESIFKAFAKAIQIAAKRDAANNNLPTTKGII